MGVRSSVGRRLSVWKWWEQGAGDTTKLDNWPLTPLQSLAEIQITPGICTIDRIINWITWPAGRHAGANYYI